MSIASWDDFYENSAASGFFMESGDEMLAVPG